MSIQSVQQPTCDFSSLQGVPFKMEVDFGSVLSIISVETYRRICQKGKKLQPFEVCACLGHHTFTVKFKHFNRPLQLVVVDGHLTSLLGLNWFDALGIHVTRVQHISQFSYEAICDEFAAVFHGVLGCNKGPPVALSLNLAVVPIHMKAQWVPFALNPKIDAELDHFIEQWILEPVPHARWETPIVTPLKANGDVRICADYKFTLNKALLFQL